MTIGADDHRAAGAGAAELLEADVAAQGGHPLHRGEQARKTKRMWYVIFLFLFLKKLETSHIYKAMSR